MGYGTSDRVQKWHRMVDYVLTLGRPEKFEIFAKYKTRRKIEKFIINVPSSGFAKIIGFQANGVNLLIESYFDAFEFSSMLADLKLDFPIVSDNTELKVILDYDGMVPEPFVKGAKYQIIVDFVTSSYEQF